MCIRGILHLLPCVVAKSRAESDLATILYAFGRWTRKQRVNTGNAEHRLYAGWPFKQHGRSASRFFTLHIVPLQLKTSFTDHMRRSRLLELVPAPHHYVASTHTTPQMLRHSLKECVSCAQCTCPAYLVGQHSLIHQLIVPRLALLALSSLLLALGQLLLL